MEDGISAPRVLRVPFPYNLPMGGPNDAARHARIALAALRLVWDLDGPAEVAL